MGVFMQEIYSLRSGDAVMFCCFWYVVIFLAMVVSIWLCKVALWRWFKW